MNKVLLFLLLNQFALAQKIGVVDFVKIYDTLPTIKIASQKNIAFLDQITHERFEFDTEIQRIAKELSSETCINPRSERVKKLMELQKLYDKRSEQLNKEMEEFRKQLFEPIISEIQAAISVVVKRNNLSFVFKKEDLLYTSDKVDITEEVLSELMIIENAIDYMLKFSKLNTYRFW